MTGLLAAFLMSWAWVLFDKFDKIDKRLKKLEEKLK